MIGGRFELLGLVKSAASDPLGRRRSNYSSTTNITSRALYIAQSLLPLAASRIQSSAVQLPLSASWAFCVPYCVSSGLWPSNSSMRHRIRRSVESGKLSTDSGEVSAQWDTQSLITHDDGARAPPPGPIHASRAQSQSQGANGPNFDTGLRKTDKWPKCSSLLSWDSLQCLRGGSCYLSVVSICLGVELTMTIICTLVRRLPNEF